MRNQQGEFVGKEMGLGCGWARQSVGCVREPGVDRWQVCVLRDLSALAGGEKPSVSAPLVATWNVSSLEQHVKKQRHHC